MTRKLRWTVLAALLALPAVAVAQQQQGSVRERDLDRARTLVEKQRYDAALAIYSALLRANPGSREAALERARTLGLAGRLDEALQAYERWIDANPTDAGAVVYIAQTLAAAGRLDDAERLFRALAAAGSPEGARGLSDIAARRAALRGGAEAAPGKRTATRQPRQTEPARQADTTRRYRVEPVGEGLDDTDGNRVRMFGGTAAFATPWRGGEVAAYARHRTAAHDPTAIFAWSSHASLTASQKVGPFAFTGAIGASRLGDMTSTPAVPTRDVVTGAASASATLGPLRIAVGGNRAPFDETAPLMLSGIVSTAVNGAMSVNLGLGLGIATEFEQAWLTGATPNTRIGGSGSLRWRAPAVVPLAAVSLAATVRGWTYELDPGEGYFAPRQYLLAETSARIAVDRDLWGVTLDGGVAAQSIDVRVLESPLRVLPHGELSIRFRPTSAIECSVSGGTTTAASPGTIQLNSYRVTGVSARTRVSF